MATGLVKRVMLSYSRESKDIVSVVYEMLQKEEIGVWFDEQDVDDTWDERYMSRFGDITELFYISFRDISE